MYAIVDGGSTKADWVILDEKKNQKDHFSTLGFNPNVYPMEQLSEALGKEAAVKKYSEGLFHIFYYGTGCGTASNQNLVKKTLGEVFSLANISVQEDTMAAAYAAYRGMPAIVCILGTGSNSCFFDGEKIRRDLPSLGFLIGDEGSGSALGKQVLRRFFMKKLPKDLETSFQETYAIGIEDALNGMYKNPRANAYLAEFNTFIAQNKKHPYFQNMVFDEMKNFFEYHVLPYPESALVEINFIGSVANEYSDIIKAAAAELNLTVGAIIQKPIESLVRYHREYILS